MLFQPAIGLGGYGGWRILQATLERQRETFDKAPSLQRNIEHFRENITTAATAEALVNDRRLLTVALGAFGLGDEINKRAFIQKILEDGTERGDAFANRLGDARFKALAEAFDYGNITNGSNILLSSFREDIIARYKALEFERAVGDVDGDMRLALDFKREISEIANGNNAEQVGLIQAMGRLPVRTLLGTAFGLPDSVAQLDIDRQLEIFRDKMRSLYGESEITAFKDPKNVEDVIRRFFLFQQLKNGSSNIASPGATALALLQSNSLGGVAGANLLLSQA
ncbi:MAG: DUF1217 domain-containing protein [Parvularculaceae bacterium]